MENGWKQGKIPEFGFPNFFKYYSKNRLFFQGKSGAQIMDLAFILSYLGDEIFGFQLFYVRKIGVAFDAQKTCFYISTLIPTEIWKMRVVWE